MASGKLLATLAVPENVTNWSLTGDRLTGSGPGPVRTIDMNPDAWFTRLRALSSRDYSDREKTVLELDSADTDAPLLLTPVVRSVRGARVSSP